MAVYRLGSFGEPRESVLAPLTRATATLADAYTKSALLRAQLAKMEYDKAQKEKDFLMKTYNRLNLVLATKKPQEREQLLSSPGMMELAKQFKKYPELKGLVDEKGRFIVEEPTGFPRTEEEKKRWAETQVSIKSNAPLNVQDISRIIDSAQMSKMMSYGNPTLTKQADQIIQANMKAITYINKAGRPLRIGEIQRLLSAESRMGRELNESEVQQILQSPSQPLSQPSFAPTTSPSSPEARYYELKSQHPEWTDAQVYEQMVREGF